MIMDNASDWELEILANAVYEAGLCPPHYPVPALLVDSIADLGRRWSIWIDDDASYGLRY